MFVVYINKTAYLCITKVKVIFTKAKIAIKILKNNSYGSIRQKKLSKGR